MASSTESTIIADVVKMEGVQAYSRQMLIVEESQTLTIGEVVCSDAVTGRYRALAAAGDGAEADAICIQDVTTGAGETTTEALFITRFAIVDYEKLDFGSGTEADAINALLTKGIKMAYEPTS